MKLKMVCAKPLVSWSMSEGSPWKRDLDTGKDRMNKEMTDSYIKEFFKTKFLKTKKNTEVNKDEQ